MLCREMDVHLRRKRNEGVLAGVKPALGVKVRKWMSVCERCGVVGIVLTCGVRTWGEQARLYGQGRSAADMRAIGADVKLAQPKRKKVTRCRPGTSRHERGEAVDWNAWEYTDVQQRAAAKIAKDCGLDSGYWWSFPDGCHLELKR
jgi:hypothetical protein